MKWKDGPKLHNFGRNFGVEVTEGQPGLGKCQNGSAANGFCELGSAANGQCTVGGIANGNCTTGGAVKP